MIREEFDKFIETTENSQAKIDESVATLLYVVKKESDTIIRKKAAIGSQMQWNPYVTDDKSLYYCKKLTNLTQN